MHMPTWEDNEWVVCCYHTLKRNLCCYSKMLPGALLHLWTVQLQTDTQTWPFSLSFLALRIAYVRSRTILYWTALPVYPTSSSSTRHCLAHSFTYFCLLRWRAPQVQRPFPLGICTLAASHRLWMWTAMGYWSTAHTIAYVHVWMESW